MTTGIFFDAKSSIQACRMSSHLFGTIFWCLLGVFSSLLHTGLGHSLARFMPKYFLLFLLS